MSIPQQPRETVDAIDMIDTVAVPGARIADGDSGGAGSGSADSADAKLVAERAAVEKAAARTATTARKTAAKKAATTRTATTRTAATRTAAKKAGTKKTAAKKAGAKKSPDAPTDAVERELREAGALVVAGVDEVGRGAWAGPVVVGAAVSALGAPPAGLTDSKLLTAQRREELAPLVAEWTVAHAFGAASHDEIDALGMTAALRLAAVRALEALPVRPDAVVLDGSHDFLGDPWQVRTVVKGDRVCVGVAAASVLAKVYRDRLMAELGLDYPEFAFCDNAGYPSPVHQAALEERGPTPIHRMSWAYLDNLPRWRHLKKVRSVLEDAGQTALDF